MIFTWLKMAKYGLVAGIGAAIAFYPIKTLGVREGLELARLQSLERSIKILREKGEYVNEAREMDNYQLCLAITHQLPDKSNDCEPLRHNQQNHTAAE